MILKAVLLLADRGLGKLIPYSTSFLLLMGEVCSYLELASKMRDKIFIGKFRANNFTERLLTSPDKQKDEVGRSCFIDLGCKMTDGLVGNRLFASAYLSSSAASCSKIPPFRQFLKSAATAHSRCWSVCLILRKIFI